MKKLTLLLFVAVVFSCSSSDEDRPITLTVGIDDDAYYEINSIAVSYTHLTLPTIAGV